jgi:D-alanyl-D-alanine carboxypeptidase/D-alanyl-D-alanine carboxypeptidase (penicillin-binding protein 5/6)
MKRLLSLAMIFCCLIISTNIAYAQPPAIEAGAYILIDAKTGDVLCEENSNETLFPASTTKIMTAILALESDIDLNTEVTASQSAIDGVGRNGSNIGIIPGEKIPLENLLQAMLISSANEAANIVSESVCESSDEFIALMNKRAKELGATGTHFENPHGYHSADHVTTASDMALIASHAMTIPKFREIVGTQSFTIPATNKHTTWPVLSNSNKLMINDKNEIYVIDGIKTGYTGPAGYNLVSSATDTNGMELIAVVMKVENEGAPENVRTYSKELLDYGFSNFKEVTLIEKERVYRNVKVEDASDIYGLDLTTEESLVRVLPKDESKRSIQEISYVNENIFAPINKGDIIGYVEFVLDGESLGKINLIAARSIDYMPTPVTLTTLTSDPKKITDNIYFRVGFLCIGFIAVFLLLRLVVKSISRRINARKYY